MGEEESGVRIPQQKRSELTRRKILEAGQRLFEKEGFHATSSKKIAREAGVSVGSFYSYFKDKKHLLLEIIEDKISSLYDLARSINESPELRRVDEKDLVRLMVFRARDMHIASPEFNREMNILCYTDDDVCRFMREKGRKIDGMVAELLRSRRDCLRVTDLEAAAHVTHSTIEFIIHQLRYMDPPLDEERIIEALVDMIHAYLFKPGCHVPDDLPPSP